MFAHAYISVYNYWIANTRLRTYWILGEFDFNKDKWEYFSIDPHSNIEVTLKCNSFLCFKLRECRWEIQVEYILQFIKRPNKN